MGVDDARLFCFEMLHSNYLSLLGAIRFGGGCLTWRSVHNDNGQLLLAENQGLPMRSESATGGTSDLNCN